MLQYENYQGKGGVMSKEREQQDEARDTPGYQHQPSRAELEADVSIPATPDELLEAMMNYKPPKGS